jgi:hypothetical protein
LGVVAFAGEADAAWAATPATPNGMAIAASIIAATSVKINLDLTKPFMSHTPFLCK